MANSAISRFVAAARQGKTGGTLARPLNVPLPGGAFNAQLAGAVATLRGGTLPEAFQRAFGNVRAVAAGLQTGTTGTSPGGAGEVIPPRTRLGEGTFFPPGGGGGFGGGFGGFGGGAGFGGGQFGNQFDVGGAITGGLEGFQTGGVGGAITGALGGGFEVPGFGGGSTTAGLTAGCPSGFESDGQGGCRRKGLVGMGERLIPGGATGTIPATGEAVVGAFGLPAMQPVTFFQETRKCPRGMVLGKDNLCYPRQILPRRSNFRKWKGARRPTLSAGDEQAIRRAARAKDRVKRIASKAGFSCKRR